MRKDCSGLVHMATEHIQVSRYGPISPKMQTTQTLPLHTQPPTQLMSHEVPQFTQLIDHDSVEHVHGDTISVNVSDLEGSGNTLVLLDDASLLRSKDGSSPPDQRDDVHANALSASPLQVEGVSHENVLHLSVTAEDYGTTNTAPSKKYITPNIPDSDATTEEGDVDGIGYLDAEADAESRPTVDTGGDGALDNLAVESTPDTALMADVTGVKSSQSTLISIASARMEPLCAPALLAANQSASSDLVRKDDVKFDSASTTGVFNSELKEPIEAVNTELGATEGPCANNAAGFDSMQTLPSNNAVTHSSRIFTSTCVSPAGASLQQAPKQDCSDQIDTVKLDAHAMEGLSPSGGVPGMLKIGIDHPERVSTPLEPLSLGLKRQHSQASLVFTSKLAEDGVANDASPGASVKRPPSTLKARELAFDPSETSLTTLTDKLNAVSNALETDCEKAAGKFISVIHAPTREQQSSLLSGLHGAATNLSYLESQQPGEETQLNAFNVVDKLVWLDTTCMPDDTVTSPVPQDGSIKDYAGAKGLRSVAQAAQMKTVRDKLDIFDWEDSQVDKGYTSPDAKQTSVNVRSRKRQSEVYKPITARKKQATSDSKRRKTTSSMENKGNDSASAGREKNTPDVAKTQVPNLELSNSNPEMKPHTFLTTRLRSRTEEAESRPSEGRKRLNLKSRPSKRVGKGKKKIDESSKKGFDVGQQKGIDNMKVKAQQAGLKVKSEPRKRAGRKESVDESGKDLKIDSSDNKGNTFPQADSLTAKGMEEPPKASKVGPEVQGNLGLADRTSQDDAVADLWIEAFASTKNKTPTGSDVELIKFRKRKALHEDTGQDSKKCRTTEPSTVETFKKDETPLKENRAEPEKSQRDFKKSENINAAKCLSQGENQDLAKKDNNLVKEQQLIIKSEKPRNADTQVKARRVSARSSGGKHLDASKREDILVKEDKAERGLKTRQDPKQCKTADASIMPPPKSRGISIHRSEGEHLNVMKQAGITRSVSILKRGPKTRSKAQDVKNIVVGSDGEEGNRAENVAIKSSTAETTTTEDGHSLSRGAMQGDFKVVKPSTKPSRSKKKENLFSLSRGVKPSTKTSRSKKKENLFSHQHSTSELNQDAKEIEADPCQAGPLANNVNEGAPVGGPKRSRRREADASVPTSTKVGGNSGSQTKEEATDKSVPKMEELMCSKKGDVSKSTVFRRTRSNMCDGGSQKNDFFDDIKKDQVLSRGESATEEQTPQNHTDIFDANKGLKKQVGKSDTKTKSVPQRNKKTSAPEMLQKQNSSDRGKRRKREPGCIRVLFSHSLSEDIINHQKKILAKLGGQVATSASDCTHFVSNVFVRTQNMLISMAAGKIVATPLWLENCSQAHYFVDAKKYILQDEKKEKELGFSMTASLASAERKPLLKGVQVLVSPNTVPEPAVLQAIVKSAGGQVMDIKSCSSLLDAKENGTLLIIIACEKDFDFCLQFLDKGLKVYSEELVLHGIVTQTLNFSRNRLFEDSKSKQQGRRRRAANINA